MHLDELPVLSLQECESRATGQAALVQEQDNDRQQEQQEQANASGRLLLQGQARPEQPKMQRGTGAAYRSNKEQCIAWPENGGLPDGPVVYR